MGLHHVVPPPDAIRYVCSVYVCVYVMCKNEKEKEREREREREREEKEECEVLISVCTVWQSCC